MVSLGRGLRFSRDPKQFRGVEGANWEIEGFLRGAGNEAPIPEEGRAPVARGAAERAGARTTAADDRSASRSILGEVQFRPNTLSSHEGFPACLLAFGSNPVDLYAWQDDDSDMLLEQDASISGQFARQWRLRTMSQEAALWEIANSIRRRLSAHNQSFARTDIASGGAALF